MVNVILVDDEKYTCLMLSDIIDWKSFNFNLCGMFYNGVSALEFIKNNPVDIVITDINMPKMSGLDLAKQLNRHFPEIYVIFISAYRDFEFARAALSLNVKDYIVKPIIYEQFENTIKAAQKYFDEKSAPINKFINTETSLLRQQFFCDCLSGLISEDNLSKNILEHIKITQNALHNKSALIEIVIKNFTQNLIENWKYEPEQIYSAIQNMIPSETDDFYISFVKYSYNHIEFVLLSKHEDNNFSQNLQSFITLQTSELCSYLNTEVEIQTVKTSNNLFNLHYSVHSGRLIDNIIRNIISHMAEFDESSTYDTLNSVFNIFSNDLEPLNNLCIRLFDEFSHLNINADYPPVGTDIEKLLSWSKSCISTYFNRTISGYNDIIKKALDYIDEHYKDFITLETVSAHVSMNPGYFSTYFKAQTGEKFIDYLVRLRIEKAMRLIEENPDIKSVVLCDYVGYKSVPYFYKIFRSFTGMTPTEYKEKILKEHIK